MGSNNISSFHPQYVAVPSSSQAYNDTHNQMNESRQATPVKKTSGFVS